ncbi:MAG TPA: helix-turn-helix domain-containing protein [Thermoanaerobaculia bacterium]|nr:helix-turn-helix domain-containing protein [Thermoanaerobaculia bacterium]
MSPGTEGSAPSELSSHDRILQAARTLFSQQGYENTTTSAISRRAGTSESQLIKHFGSKEGLLEAIFEQGWRRLGGSLRQVMEQTSAPLERLHALTGLLVDALERDKDLRTLMLLEGRRIRKHGHMVALTRGFLQVVGGIDRVLAEMRDAGQLRTDLHLEAMRSAVIGAFEGLLRDQILAERGDYPASYSPAEMREALRSLLDCFLVPQPAGSPV